VAGGSGIRGQGEGAVGLGRHDFGQALSPETRKMELVTHHWSGKHQFPATFGCTIGPYRERLVTTIVGLAGEGKGVGPGARVCADG